LGDLGEANHLEDLGIDGKIGLILKRILKDGMDVFGQYLSGLG
jgi:hypothetical protein